MMSSLYARTASAPAAETIKASGASSGSQDKYDGEQEQAQTATGENAAVDFAYRRDALLSSIETSTELVGRLSEFNDKQWTMHYPHAKLGFVDTGVAGSSSSEQTGSTSSPRAAVKRAASMFGDVEEIQAHEKTAAATARPAIPQRAFSTMTPASTAADGENHQQARTASHPLAIDLRLGAPGSTNAFALMESMSRATVAELLSARFDVAKRQLRALDTRVRDNQSRILITGDVNAGKSTFVNALLRRDILPTDQQPLTTVFCEVLDAQAYNDGKEEVHAILQANIAKYDKADSATFERFELGKLEEIATDEDQRYGMVKIYLEDARAPVDATPTNVVDHETTAEEEAAKNKSFIRNGIVSISLIDGPGLNKDTLSTTGVFARQSEIDVIVFIVSAENHFTLSGKEFLFNAAMEKAYVFIVVNKFKGIRDKKRCQRAVDEQIRQLSPKTYENRTELVHYVEAAQIIDEIHATLEGKEVKETDDESFSHLEESLRSFLLLKRSISKLTPAKHYLVNLLSNLAVVAEANLDAADLEADEAQRRLDLVKPIHDKLERERDLVEEAVGQEEENRVEAVIKASRQTLDAAVQVISSGGHSLALPEYPGLLAIWDWAAQVKSTLVDFIESQVVHAEEDARKETIDGVNVVFGDLSKKYLPSVQAAMEAGSSAGGAANAIPQRVFNHQRMFAKQRQRRQKARALLREGENQDTAILYKPVDIEISFLDAFDLDRLMSLPSTLPWTFGKKTHEHALIEASSALSVVSLGAGALTMFGTRIIGIKSIIEAVTTTCEILGSKAARKWAGPIAGVMTLALAAYFVHDLPRAIPYNVGRKLHAQLLEEEFIATESDRIAKETRKIMRLAGWDLRERFRKALEASTKDVEEVEGKLAKAEEAIRFLENYLAQVQSSQHQVRAVSL